MPWTVDAQFSTRSSSGAAADGKRPVAAAKEPAARSKGTTRTPRRSTRRPVAAPLRGTEPRGEWALASDFSKLLSARVRTGTWGVMVVSLSKGDTLYSHNADLHLLPASTMKLFTTALAFEQLGPAHQFETELFRTGTLSADGTLHGDLILRGGGDPALSNRFLPGDPNAPTRELAKLAAAAGIRRVQGNVIGDATAFEARRIPEGWHPRYLQDSYAQRVSALSLNENLLHVVVSPGKGKGNVSLIPGTSAFSIRNETRIQAGSRGARLTVARSGETGVVVRGWIGSKASPRTYVVVVEDPAMFATGAFRNALADQGIVVSGATTLGATPASAVRIGVLTSPPLAHLATIMNQESVNHFAELIFRDVARHGDATGIGSASSANSLLQQFLANRVGSTRDAVYAADGSGLSLSDRVTSRALVQLLAYADRAPWGQEFHRTLPVAGKNETLRRRMVGTPAQGNLHAKTGTMSDVVALGGYVTARNGEQLAFSFLYNGRERWPARETIDAMGATLAGFVR